MPVIPFNAGRFSAAVNCVEWDGTNHDEILTWIRGQDPDTDPAMQVVIHTASATELVLFKPGVEGTRYDQTVTLAPDEWITVTVVGNGLAIGRVNPVGMWRTTDVYGRPLTLNELLAPGDGGDPGPGPDPEPPALSPPRNLALMWNQSTRRVTATWQSPEHGTAVAYQVHELRKYPSSTLKATVTTTSRTSGSLNPFMGLEYAIAAVAADGTISKFSNTVILNVTESGATVVPGQSIGWDSAMPDPEPDPDTDPTQPDDPADPPDPSQPTDPPVTGPQVPWTKTFLDGTKYNTPTGADDQAPQNISSLSSLASGMNAVYTGPALTTSTTISGKSNFTLKGVRLNAGGKLVVKDCSNYWLDDLDLTYEPSSDSQAGDLVALRGTGNRAGVRNSVFGPSTYSLKSSVTSTVQFLAVLDAMDHVYLDRVTFRNKSTPGNAYRIYGDYTATGGCQYSVASQCLWTRAEPYRENDQEAARFGTSQMMQTDGYHIVEFSRIENVATEPELLSFKMNKSVCRGSTFQDCVGSPVFRHGNNSEIYDCYMVGDRTATAPNSTTQRTSAGFRGYGRGHKAHHLTIRVNGTSKYEAPFLIDEGDTSPESLSNGHANNVGWRVSNILLVKCGSPFVVGANYSTAPSDCRIEDSWVVECADAGTTGLKVASGGNGGGVTLADVQVYGSTAAAGLTQGASGEWKAPGSADRGARTPFVTATMAGKGATWDPWAGLSGGGTPDEDEQPPAPNPTAQTAAERFGWGTPLPSSDEFNYTGAPNSSKWKLPGTNWAGHNGNGRRRPERQTVDGEKLIMTGLANGDTGWMQHQLDQEGGRWEVRLRAYPGAPSAGESNSTSNGNDYHVLALIWPESNSRQTDGEYDFVETGVPGAQSAEAYIHFPHPWTSQVQQRHFEKAGIDQTQWHNYAIEYKRGADGYVKGFIDGVEWFSTSGGAQAGLRRDIQDMPAGHLCLQLDNFDGTSQTPATMEVDWVRAYSLNNSGGGVVVPPTNPPSTGAKYPMDLLPDHWKLTLPLWDPNNSSKVWEVVKDGSPDLDTFSNDYFKLNASKTGIEMVSFYEGATTPNSKNTRSELREMTANGKSNAVWSTNSGNHKCVIVTQVDRLDGNHCVIGQIHGGDDDVTVFRLEGSTLWATDGDTAHGRQLLTGYQLGTPLAIAFHVAGGNCDYYVDVLADAAEAAAYDTNGIFTAGNRKHSLSVSDSSCYFKAGNYLQRKGSPGSKTQVTLYKATVAHY